MGILSQETVVVPHAKLNSTSLAQTILSQFAKKSWEQSGAASLNAMTET